MKTKVQAAEAECQKAEAEWQKAAQRKAWVKKWGKAYVVWREAALQKERSKEEKG